MMITRICLLIFLLSMSILFGVCRADKTDINSESSTPANFQYPEARLPITKDDEFKMSTLGGLYLPVFIDPSTKNNTLKKFYVRPVFLPNWEKFTNDYRVECDGKSINKEVYINLEYQLGSAEVIREVKVFLAKKGNAPGQFTVHSYPYAFIQFETGLNSKIDNVPSKWRGVYPPGVDSDILSGGAIATIVSFQVKSNSLLLKDTCQQLLRISKNKDVRAQMFSLNKNLQINVTNIALNKFIDSEELEKLFSEQSSEGVVKVVSSTSGGAVGFNFDILGGAKDSGTLSIEAIDTRKRAVSLNLIQSAAEDVVENLKMTKYSEFKSSDHSESSLVELMLDYFKRRSQHIDARITKTKNNQWAVKDKNFSVLLSGEEVDQLLESSVAPDIKVSSKAKYYTEPNQDDNSDSSNERKDQNGDVSRTGKPKEITKDLTYKDKRDIKWKKNGDDWVPTSAELYITSLLKFRSGINFSFEDIVSSNQSGLLRTVLPISDSVQPYDQRLDLTFVTDKPNANLSAKKQSIVKGGSALLLWNTNQASTVEIDNDIGRVGSSGELYVSPDKTTVYELKASNSKGESIARVVITVHSRAEFVLSGYKSDGSKHDKILKWDGQAGSLTLSQLLVMQDQGLRGTGPYTIKSIEVFSNDKLTLKIRNDCYLSIQGPQKVNGINSGLSGIPNEYRFSTSAVVMRGVPAESKCSFQM